ncbi:MAG: hypothetical protein EBS05_05805 [Proteobacteria bacterium]|nr:hypothetical protein [Pseudomonadota bacterium]
MGAPLVTGPLSDAELLAQFEACTLPAEGWHHAEHIRIGYLYLRAYGFTVALDRMRVGLKRLNAAQQVPEALDRGYHETLTRAWLQLVHVILSEYGPAETSLAFLEQHPELSQRKSLRLFYTRDRLMSWPAKAEFMPPDLAPLPVSLRANKPDPS